MKCSIKDIQRTITMIESAINQNNTNYESQPGLVLYIVGSQTLWRAILNAEKSAFENDRSKIEAYIHALHYNHSDKQATTDLDIRIEPVKPNFLLYDEYIYIRSHALQRRIHSLTTPTQFNLKRKYRPVNALLAPLFYKMDTEQLPTYTKEVVVTDVTVLDRKSNAIMNIDIKMNADGVVIYDENIASHQTDFEDLFLMQKRIKVYNLESLSRAEPGSEAQVRLLAHIIKKCVQLDNAQLGIRLDSDSAFVIKRILEAKNSLLYKKVFDKISALYFHVNPNTNTNTNNEMAQNESILAFIDQAYKLCTASLNTNTIDQTLMNNIEFNFKVIDSMMKDLSEYSSVNYDKTNKAINTYIERLESGEDELRTLSMEVMALKDQIQHLIPSKMNALELKSNRIKLTIRKQYEWLQVINEIIRMKSEPSKADKNDSDSEESCQNTPQPNKRRKKKSKSTSPQKEILPTLTDRDIEDEFSKKTNSYKTMLPFEILIMLTRHHKSMLERLLSPLFDSSKVNDNKDADAVLNHSNTDVFISIINNIRPSDGSLETFIAFTHFIRTFFQINLNDGLKYEQIANQFHDIKAKLIESSNRTQDMVSKKCATCIIDFCYSLFTLLEDKQSFQHAETIRTIISEYLSASPKNIITLANSVAKLISQHETPNTAIIRDAVKLTHQHTTVALDRLLSEMTSEIRPESARFIEEFKHLVNIQASCYFLATNTKTNDDFTQTFINAYAQSAVLTSVHMKTIIKTFLVLSVNSFTEPVLDLKTQYITIKKLSIEKFFNIHAYSLMNDKGSQVSDRYAAKLSDTTLSRLPAYYCLLALCLPNNQNQIQNVQVVIEHISEITTHNISAEDLKTIYIPGLLQVIDEILSEDVPYSSINKAIIPKLTITLEEQLKIAVLNLKNLNIHIDSVLSGENCEFEKITMISKTTHTDPDEMVHSHIILIEKLKGYYDKVPDSVKSIPSFDPVQYLISQMKTNEETKILFRSINSYYVSSIKKLIRDHKEGSSSGGYSTEQVYRFVTKLTPYSSAENNSINRKDIQDTLRFFTIFYTTSMLVTRNEEYFNGNYRRLCDIYGIYAKKPILKNIVQLMHHFMCDKDANNPAFETCQVLSHFCAYDARKLFCIPTSLDDSAVYQLSLLIDLYYKCHTTQYYKSLHDPYDIGFVRELVDANPSAKSHKSISEKFFLIQTINSLMGSSEQYSLNVLVIMTITYIRVTCYPKIVSSIAELLTMYLDRQQRLMEHCEDMYKVLECIIPTLNKHKKLEHRVNYSPVKALLTYIEQRHGKDDVFKKLISIVEKTHTNLNEFVASEVCDNDNGINCARRCLVLFYEHLKQYELDSDQPIYMNNINNVIKPILSDKLVNSLFIKAFNSTVCSTALYRPGKSDSSSSSSSSSSSTQNYKTMKNDL